LIDALPHRNLNARYVDVAGERSYAASPAISCEDASISLQNNRCSLLPRRLPAVTDESYAYWLAQLMARYLHWQEGRGDDFF